MKAVGAVLAAVFALALQTTMARFLSLGPFGVDLVLVVVVFVALKSGAVSGLFTGTLAGLVQDALTPGSSVIGIGGLAKTLVGFFTGVVGTQFIVSQTLPRFVVFFGATLLHAAVFMGLYVALGLRSFGAPYAAIAGQALGNAIVGVVAFKISEFLPGAVERRRVQRGGRRH